MTFHSVVISSRRGFIACLRCVFMGCIESDLLGGLPLHRISLSKRVKGFGQIRTYPPALGAAAEAVEGAQSHVLLVGDAAWPAAQGGAGMADQQGEVALPQRPRRVRAAGLQQSEPVCDGTPGRHRAGSSGW